MPSAGSAAFVAPLAGGTPTRLLSDFVVLREPVWSPDGRSVLIAGRRDRPSPIADTFDWWWVPLQGGSPVKTGVLDLPGLRAAGPEPRDWTASGVLLSDGINLWSIPMSESTGKIIGEPRQLTFGTGEYADPTIARDGTIAFSALTMERVIERVALGDSQPNVERLYADGLPGTGRASISRDGSLMAFERNIQTHCEIWLKNLRTGQQVMLLGIEAPCQLSATISEDGARVAYTVVDDSGQTGRGFVVETSGGFPKTSALGARSTASSLTTAACLRKSTAREAFVSTIPRTAPMKRSWPRPKACSIDHTHRLTIAGLQDVRDSPRF